jgi:MFS family permease
MRTATDSRDLTAPGVPLVCLLSDRTRGGAVRRVWLRVALATGAGFASLVVCSGALVAIVLLLLNTTEWSVFGGSASWPSPIFWVGLVILIIVAAAGLSLPARALGAKRDHVTNTAVLSVLGLCAFVFFVVVSLVNPFVGVPLALMAIVATPVIGSLFAIREDYHYTVGLVRATVIAAVAIYCASLLAIWLAHGVEGWLYYLVPVIVASSSWVVVPGIVASLRPE